MCYHAFYISTICGHCWFGLPLLPCPYRLSQPISPSSVYSDDPNCTMRAHPFRSLKIERICLECREKRKELLRAIDESGLLELPKIEERKWRVAFQPQPAVDVDVRAEGDMTIPLDSRKWVKDLDEIDEEDEELEGVEGQSTEGKRLSRLMEALNEGPPEDIVKEVQGKGRERTVSASGSALASPKFKNTSKKVSTWFGFGRRDTVGVPEE